MNQKEIVGFRFRDVGLATDRFVSVRDGEKMCVDHDSRYTEPSEVPGENYGIYCDADDQLVILDVDAHRDGDDTVEKETLLELNKLGLTLRVRSPHADPKIGGHRLYKLAGDETPAELFTRVFGTANPVASWGEVLAKNKYAVGAGSKLDGCSKEWCDGCSDADGGDYVVDEDREIAEIEPEALVDALAADAELERTDTPDHSDISAYDDADANSGGDRDGDELTREQVEELLEAIPGRQHFDDWIRTGYAVYSWDSGERGKEVFEQWSRDNPKWEEQESQRQIDYIWSNGDDSDGAGNAGVGTLVHLARQNGYDGSLGASSSDAVTYDSDSSKADWGMVRSMYDTDVTTGQARLAAADVLDRETSWMYVLESERLWVYDDDSGRYARYGRAWAGDRLETELRGHYSQTEKREIIGRLEDRHQVRRSELNARDRDEKLLCVANGVVDLETGELLEHDPKYRFVRGLDVAFDPETAEKEPILSFLDDVTARTADRDTLLDHLAHGLMPGHPYRAFVVCYGPGGNGKTQVAELFRGFVGESNAAAVEIDELANDDHATSDLPGTFINWGDDMAGDGGGTLQDLSLLKKASGGSEIRCNEKYEKTFNFKNEAALFFSANEPPRIGEQKRSIQDRIYPIEMPYVFKSEPDADEPMEKPKEPNVSDKLLSDDAAMRGLLLLAIEHAQELIERRGEYSQPETPEERLEKYNKSADPIVKFGTRLVEKGGPDSMVRKDDVYKVYQTFAEAQEERAASADGFKRQFTGALGFGIEHCQTRSLARDGEDRATAWKRLQWADDARGYMPDWMVERYADHFGDDESDDSAPPAAETGGSADATPHLAELEPGRHSGVTVEATVAEKLGQPKQWLQAEGTLVDDGHLLDYEARGETNPLLDVNEGDRIRITHPKVTEQNGVLTLEVSGVCEIEIVETADGDDDPDADTIASLADGDDGVTVEARAEDRTTDTPDAIAEKATLVDVTDEINVAVWADANKPPLEAGEHYRLKDATVDTFDGERVVYVNSATGVEPIGAGVGNAPATDPGANKQLDGAATDGGTTHDGPPADADDLRADAQRVASVLRDRGSPIDSIPALAAQVDGLTPERVRDAVEYGTRNGLIIDGPEGYTDR